MRDVMHRAVPEWHEPVSTAGTIRYNDAASLARRAPGKDSP
jgi:hypothetical protein